MWPLCLGPATVSAKWAVKRPHKLDTEECGAATEGWRGDIIKHCEDKSGPHAMKNVNLSLTSVANEA